MLIEKYFPQGIATDQAFCNRHEERNLLKASIESHEHVVVVAPRRYGKTSLIAQVLKENTFIGANIDLLFALTPAEVNKHIYAGISLMLNKLLPKLQSKRQKLINTVKNLNPKITFNLFGQKLEIISRSTADESITEPLLTLDMFAKKANKSCVVVFDEFQQISELKENHTIEAAIRHAVERSQYVSYVFCGSKRHCLNAMFSDKSRPLYHLCDLMTIDRISSQCYAEFLTKAAKNQWQRILDKLIIEEIIALTENHPYYVNALCRRLWRQPTYPSISNVRQAWDEYVKQQSAWIINDLSNLTLNRRKVLFALANQPENEPQGQSFSSKISLSPSGIQKSLVDLLKLDLICRDKQDYYCVLDPAMRYYIAYLLP
ncbi:MAG: ATP-binding protein [Pseudomonadota bacterium]